MEDKIFNFLINYFSNINDGGVDEMNNFRGDITSDEIVEWLQKVQNIPVEQSNKDLEKAAKEYVKENCILPEDCNDGDIPYYEECTATVFKDGANWQKEQITKLLKTIYSDCDNLKKDLDRVTTGNLPHRIGNIKFSITGIQVIIKQVMEGEQ